MQEITVYTTVPCPYCSRAKALLDARGFKYREVNLASDPDGRTELANKTGMMTFPQIIIGETNLGGWDDLSAADSNGRLAELISA
jgi:glutaredoxin 3